MTDLQRQLFDILPDESIEFYRNGGILLVRRTRCNRREYNEQALTEIDCDYANIDLIAETLKKLTAFREKPKDPSLCRTCQKEKAEQQYGGRCYGCYADTIM